jgi:anhydro-N-acetylmuramic acid kinase
MADLMISLGITGTSDDSGIKASLLCSEGNIIVEKRGSLFFPYSNDLKRKILAAKAEMLRLYNYKSSIPANKGLLAFRLGKVSKKKEEINQLSGEITEWCLHVIKNLMKKEKAKISVIGFNGHQILFKAKSDKGQAISYSLGNPHVIAKETNCTTVYDFSDADIAHEGNGKPLYPMFYRALFHYSACRNFLDSKQTIAVVNIEDMANVTILNLSDVMESYEVGPGNILINEFVQRNFQKSNDRFGELAIKGEVSEILVRKWLEKPIIPSNKRTFEISDFMEYLTQASKTLIPVDCIATLTAFTAKLVMRKIILCGHFINTIILTGQESRNEFLKTLLNRSYNIISSDNILWDNDFFESEQYAFYAIRSLLVMPNSFPSTTGVSRPVCSGRLTFPTFYEKENTAVNA